MRTTASKRVHNDDTRKAFSNRRTLLRHRIKQGGFSLRTGQFILAAVLALLFFVYGFVFIFFLYQPTAETAQLNLVKYPITLINRHEVWKSRDDLVTYEESTPPLRAYLETPVHQEDWDLKPLPVRNTTRDQLKVIEYPRVKACSKLQEQFPIDDYPDADPFLPWIHDVFPTHDGQFIQFVAQNKRRCRTGTTQPEMDILKHMEPQVALFQHVAVKRISKNNTGGETRYRLSSHEDADPDGLDARFICRFKPSMQETLSVFNVHYEYASFRKGFPSTFSKKGRDNNNIHTSQLLFMCPVPENLQEMIRTGASVDENDRARLLVDVIPIRTPVRYGHPAMFFPPRYEGFQIKEGRFDANVDFGENHTLPRVEDSGRWENIPVCRPSFMTYEPYASETVVGEYKGPTKKHRLVACTWASTGYATRGDRFAINDGQRRLQEWIEFNLLVGVDHFYIYDNSGAHSNETSLKVITDLYPQKVTRVVWPAKICNNNPNNVDSVGERSSQYAAESSCRLRFGPYVDWIGGFDIDEYLVPMGNTTSLIPIIDNLDRSGKTVISFHSYRSWPRRKLIEEPVPILANRGGCRGRTCFELRVPTESTILQTYNCDRQLGLPKHHKKEMPAEKQLYRADYVLLHMVHYSTITKLSAMNKEETIKAGRHWARRIRQDPLSRFADEETEATMLHAKAMATQDTSGWLEACKKYSRYSLCRIGTPYPPGAYEANLTNDQEGWLYNCWVNKKIEETWVPQLAKAMEKVPKPWSG